jgi:hypothetical protein
MITRTSLDLISYRTKETLLGDRRQGRESVIEYSSSCIDMSADQVLISASEAGP